MGPEWIVVGIIAVVVLFGAKKLPEMARNVGRAQGEFKKGIKEGNVDEPADSDASRSPSRPSPSPPSESPPASSSFACRSAPSARLLGLRPAQLPGDPPQDAVHEPA